MNRILLVVIILVCGMAQPTAAQERTIFRFDVAGTRAWGSVNDGVMGGRSSGRSWINRSRFLEFSGNLSLANNGGFASIRTTKTGMGLKANDSIVMLVRGDGRKYNLNLYTQGNLGGYSYRQSFKTERGQWLQFTFPVSRFVATWRGRYYPSQRFVPSRAAGIGILIGDKVQGPFKLEIAWIKVKTPQAAETKPAASKPKM